MVHSSALIVVFSMILLGTLDATVRRSYNSRHYCGSDLANALSSLCDGKYKRSDLPSNINTASIIPDYNDENEWGFALDRQNALSVIRTTGRNDKRGIIDECCRSACTVDELRGYCSQHNK